MSATSRGARITLLMAVVAAGLYWVAHHAEVSLADGLRSVRQAGRIDRGDLAGGLWRSIDHPMHPLAVAAVHRVIGGGDAPYAWQTAAQFASVLTLVLAAVPLYLLARELFDDDATASLAVLLVLLGPVACAAAVNVLSETTFLLFWTWGLWASARFLRDGSFAWLVPAVGFGALAYLTRPEGVLIHAALVATMLLLTLSRGTRILWPRWCAAVAVLVLGPVVLVGPYVAVKGGVGTKPAVARLIGTEPEAPPEALERERPPTPGQSTAARYADATGRVFKAVRGAVTWPLLPLSAAGIYSVFRGSGRGRARAWVFLGAIGGFAAAGLVRLHATGGYCTVRHALIPGVILTLFAARGLVWVLRDLPIDGRWLGLGEGRVRPGPLVWAVALVVLLALPVYQARTPYGTSFGPYRQAGLWLAGRPEADGALVDLTDWTLFFSGKRGDGFAGVLDAVDRPGTRYVVLRKAHMNGHLHYNDVVRRALAGRAPGARFPEQPAPRQLQVAVYDLAAPAAAQGTRLR